MNLSAIKRILCGEAGWNLFHVLVSIMLGFLAGAVVLSFSGISPLEAGRVVIRGTFGRPAYVMYTVIKATPLIMTGLSVALAFRSGLFNIGAEGQFIIGSVVAALAGYFIHLPSYVHVPLILILSLAAAGIWGALAGFLKARYGTHEVVSTIMLNWIALHLQNFTVMREGFRMPDNDVSYPIHQTANITFFEEWKYSEQGRQWLTGHPFLQDILKTPANWGIIAAVALAFAVWFLLKRTSLGYELRAVGFNRNAAEYGGIGVGRGMIVSMFLSGALAGLAGAIQVLGVSKNIAVLSSMEGYGFDGIAVALMGNVTAAGCVLSALLLGALKYGGSKIQPALGAPSEIITIITGMIVFFIAFPHLGRAAAGAIRRRRRDA